MHSIRADNFNLRKIADSGQCFRMNHIGRGVYSVVAYNKYVEVSQSGDEITFSCSELEYEETWKKYFDLETDYQRIIDESERDEFLDRAIEFGSGIRILNQDLWETLITFIISQRKSIPQITRCVEKLCQEYGDDVVGCAMDGTPVYAKGFPTPEALIDISLHSLRECGVGYRDVYIHDATEWFIDNISSCRRLFYTHSERCYTNSKNLFIQLHGVGNKVANCICLFGLHLLQACPIDTHMQHIIDEEYRGIMPGWMSSKYAGVLQQYCFFYQRYRAYEWRYETGNNEQETDNTIEFVEW